MNQAVQDVSELNVVEQPWRSRMAARTREVFRRNMIPGIILQFFVIAVVGGYYLVEPVTVFFNQIASMKQTYGFYFSAVSTAVFGGLIPFLVQKARPKYRHLMPTSHVWFFLILWSLKGIEIDLLYRGQAMMFGSGKDILTVLYKVGFDAFIYVPLWGLTSCAVAMAWRQMGFDFGRTFALLKQSRWWTDNMMAILIANWMIWLVAVAGIYCLPLGLQLPVQNIVLCFWCILLIFLSDENM